MPAPDPVRGEDAAARRAAERDRLRADAEREAAHAGAERWMAWLTGGEGSLRWPAVALAGFVAMVSAGAWLLLAAGSLRLPLGGVVALFTLVYAGVFEDSLLAAATGSEILRVVAGLAAGVFGLVLLPTAVVALMAAFAGWGPIRLVNVGLGIAGFAAMLVAGGGSLGMAWVALSRRCDALATHAWFRRERLRS